MGLIGPMQGPILTQSQNPLRLATPPGSTSPTLLEQFCGFFYVPQEQIDVATTGNNLSNDDGDGNENGKRAKVYISKATGLLVHHALFVQSYFVVVS